jgi:type III secretion protein J
LTAIAGESAMSMCKPIIRRAAVLVMVVLLAGCQDTLFSKLSEAQTNEVLAALAEARIGASKERVDDQTWRVQVSSDRMGEALVYLRDRGLPVRPSPTMGEVFKKDGMISTPMEERARYAWALQEGIAATLRRIDGVTEARVHVALPHNDPLTERPLPSSAAVFVKHRQTLDVEALAPQIKSMVMGSVEGLDYRNISLFAYPVDARPLAQSTRSVAAYMPLSVANAAAAPPQGIYDSSIGALPSWLWWLAVPLVGAVAASLFWRRRRQQTHSLRNRPAPRAADALPAVPSHAALPEGVIDSTRSEAKPGPSGPGTASAESVNTFPASAVVRPIRAGNALATLPRQGQGRTAVEQRGQRG